MTPPDPARRVTRLAPSPTGALHLGNARTFLANWLLARQNGWRIVLRIDDLDGPRIKRGADRAAIDDLAWLGIDWDDGPVYQSTCAAAHDAAVERLIATGHAYPCICTRAEVERAASAPHADDGSAVYGGTCRGRFATVADARAANNGLEPAIRFRVDDDRLFQWTDGFAGPQSIRLGTLGDFVIRKSDGTAAYQLATVVDDAAAGVTDVVRGDDLLDSTPRQLLLYETLALQPTPTYVHLPLVLGSDGRRLAKRHGDTRLASYRDAGVSADSILALLAGWIGIRVDPGQLVSAASLVERFDLAKMPREAIRFVDDPRVHSPSPTA